ncbi:hypothetical protein [Rhodovulum visakhapatnamense]|uniref:Muramidase (Phage lysozyme) n=1 Tax=Rhodovulum visakhapatnamense TaxID=364297 RepID=A0A4V3GSQ0_9RHOB|nr:hypothetical protein [Rhodovulum visakhapatnamense]TDX23773.1 hypothetical protein EV657_12538 [Rhodovulum visakhapatnamense]
MPPRNRVPMLAVELALALILGLGLALASVLRPALAEPVSLIAGGGFLGAAGGASGPLLTQMPASGPGPSGASLFAGREGSSLFAPSPDRPQRAAPSGPVSVFTPLRPGGTTAALAEGIRLLIGRAEAGRMGYDAVQHGAKILPPGRPTQLTIGQIYKWIADTPGQPHAIGRYQFIPETLRRLVAELGLSERTQFSAPVQDRLADLLLEEAGLSAFGAGDLKRKDFMHNLAQIWAGLPTASGRSYYHGVAGNRATMTWAQFEDAMTRIAPAHPRPPKDG